MINRKAYYKAHYYHAVRLSANACLLLMSTLCHAQSSLPPVYQSATSTSLLVAGRILNQASFGPNVASLLHVEQIGVEGYVTEQLAKPAYVMPQVIPATDYDNNGGDCAGWNCDPEAWWWEDVLFGQDQLRQRVAFALSKLFVVSMNKVDARYYPYYLNALSRDAFGNWFTLMQDVSLSPAMGTYLDIANSQAPSSGGHADENFAREMMQLFSIGTVALNQDGSTQLDSHGNAIANYTPAVIQSFARAYTGYTFAQADCSTPAAPQYYWWPSPPGVACPMVPIEAFHDRTEKILLRGTILPAGQDAPTDFTAALQNIFEDPSLPPFVCRRLIQNLVKSNPSPSYINRVATVFINDGNGVRGDMKAVLYAILLDPEARSGDAGGIPDPNSGLMRDPVLLYTSFLRAVNATQNLPIPFDGVYAKVFDDSLNDLAESPHQAPSVFSFYSPDFTVSTGSNTPLYAPELQLENVQTLSDMILHLQDLVDNNVRPKDFTIDLSATSPLSQIALSQGPEGVINILDAVLMHGTMTSQMRVSILNAITGLEPMLMAKNAVFLVVSSPQYRTMI